MSSLRELMIGSKLLRQIGAVVCAASLFACSTSGTTRPAAVATQDESGFTITEKVNVSTSVRSKFKNALRVLGEKQYDHGIALLADATEAAPNVTSLHIDLGIAYGQIGDHERAEESIKRALQLNPLHPVAHNELGIIYRKTGRFERARESYESALEVHPDFHFARRNLAILCDVYLGDLGCALENYQAYGQMVTDDEAVDMWIADLRVRIGE
jgi:tetratricopeptide (TPR) repeat protein